MPKVRKPRDTSHRENPAVAPGLYTGQLRTFILHLLCMLLILPPHTEKSFGQHLLKNPGIVDAIIEKVGNQLC